MSLNRKTINLSQIVREISKMHSSENGVYEYPIAIKIVKKYFEYITLQIISSYMFRIPRIGDIYVEKRNLDPNKFSRIGFRKKCYYNTFKMNYKRAGESYHIILKSDLLERTGIKFKAAKKVTSMLYKVLTKTNIEFRWQLEN